MQPLPNPVDSNDLYALIDSLKASLTDRATGGTGTLTTAEYARIRRILLEHPSVKDRVPDFIRKCRTIDEFWSFIKAAHDSYAKRRDYLAESFNPLLDELESNSLGTTSSFDEGTIIGKGGFGIVYKRRHKWLDKDFAFKVFAPAFESSEDSDNSIARFFQEARILFELQSPYIIKIYDVGMENKRPFIKMEYFDGVSLDRTLSDRGAIPYKTALHIIKNTTLAIGHAHEKGVLHRDLKPSNIMTKKGGQLRVIDFGLGVYIEKQLLSRITEQGHRVAGGIYTAPELLHDPTIRDYRCDIYSIGAIWHYLLVGRPPAGADIREALDRVNQLPARHKELVIECLRSIDSRISSCELLLKGIGEIEHT